MRLFLLAPMRQQSRAALSALSALLDPFLSLLHTSDPDIAVLLQVEPWQHTRDETSETNRPSILSRILGEDPVDSDIIGAIANLSNHIKESQATKDLLKCVLYIYPTPLHCLFYFAERNIYVLYKY